MAEKTTTTCVLVNEVKEERARKIIKNEGRDLSGGQSNFAEANLYRQGLDLGLKGEDLVMHIYKGLGGLVKEFSTPVEAEGYKEKLKSIRRKTAGK